MLANINIMTSENDIDVKYGMIDFGPEREAARTSLKYIYTDMGDIKQSYFKLGFHLNEFKECKYYKDFGYATFEEFCEHNFDIDKSAISRCINVFLMTTSQGEKRYYAGSITEGCASQMSDKYKEYSYSQLCEMLPLDDQQRSLIKPDMTIKQIRDMKNKISDITKIQLMKFFEYFKEIVKPFTREELLKVFDDNGRSFSGHGSDELVYDFKPGKVRLFYGNYYSFAKIIKYYEDCGGTFDEEIATSQPLYDANVNNRHLCVNDLVNKNGIVLMQHIKNVAARKTNVRIDVYDSNGKLLEHINCDILLSGDNNIVCRCI